MGYFTLSGETMVLVGFFSQSPTGKGCTAVFDTIGYHAERLRELRDGSQTRN